MEHYGKSPLEAIAEIFERQRIAQEFHRKLYQRSLNIKPATKKVDFVQYILSENTDLEWLPMDFSADIFSAFGLPNNLTT